MAGATDPRFAEVERQYYALKGRLSSGQLTRDQFEAALQKLMLLDSQSRYWMMGAESGKWYMYDGQNWQQAEPPTPKPPEPPPAAPAPQAAAASQPDSATLASFTTPSATPRPDSETIASFTPPATAAGSSSSGTAPKPAAASPSSDAAPAPSASSAATAEAVTPDSAPTQTFTPPVVPSGTVQRDQAPTQTLPAAGAAATARDSAPTMASFVPPSASKVAPDKAATVASFTPPRIPPAVAAPVARPLPAAAAGRKLSPALVFGCLFALVCLGGLVALAFAVNSRFGSAPEPTLPPVAVAAVSAAAAAVVQPTATSIPPGTSAPASTATSVPTAAPAVATSTPPPLPTAAPTTRPPVVIPVTATSRPLPVPDTPTPAPADTDTPAPVPTRPPAVEFPNSFAYIGYEKWGRPNSDCSAFNNKDAVRQFKWEELVTNKTATAISGADWGMTAVTNNEGSQSAVCAYDTPGMTIPPGQTAKVTFAGYVEPNQFVQRIRHQIRNTVYVHCLDAGAHEVAC